MTRSPTILAGVLLAACGGAPAPSGAPLVNTTPAVERPALTPAEISDCPIDEGYQLDRHVAPDSDGEPGLHVVGIYEAPTRPGFRATHEGTATVTVRRSGIVVLLSYDPTLWVVESDGALTERVIVSSSAAQSPPTVPDGVPVEVYSGDRWGGFASVWPMRQDLASCGQPHAPYREDCDGIDDARRAIAWAEQRAGRALTTFHGCYRMGRLVVQ